jgi:hypothetical protein
MNLEGDGWLARDRVRDQPISHQKAVKNLISHKTLIARSGAWTCEGIQGKRV